MIQHRMFGMTPADKQYRALTIDAWWAHAIAHGTKRVENRGWRTKYRGELLIHAGKTTRRDNEAIAAIFDIDSRLLSESSKLQVEQSRGRVIAVAELVDCVSIDDRDRVAPHNAWAFGPWCWVLSRVRVLERPIRVSGLQGLWCPGGDLVRQVENQLAIAQALDHTR